MNVEIGAEAALFPEKEYIKGIFVAVHAKRVQFRFFSRNFFFCETGAPYLVGLGAADDPLDDGGVVVLVVANVVDPHPDLALRLDRHDLQVALVKDATLEHLDR
jgi:hypothetical protein